MENETDSNALAKSLIKLISNSSDAQTLLSEIASHLGQSFQVDICLVVAGISSQEISQIGFWHKNDRTLETTDQLSFLLNHILAESEPVSLADWPSGQDETISNWLKSLSLVALLALRTDFQGTANGLILLGSLIMREWTEAEKKLIIEIKEVVAIACIMAQLQKEVSQFTEKENFSNPNQSFANLTRSASGQGSPLMRRLYELMRQQLEQQRQLNVIKDEIIDAISDKARNPLSSMKLAIDALSNPERQLSPQSQATFWNILRQEWGTLNDLINNIVLLKKLESQELEYRPQTVNLTWLLQDIAQQFQKQWTENRRKQLTLVVTPQLNDSWSLYSDPIHLRTILQELLTNAGNFSTSSTTVYLEVSQQNILEREQIVIKISNTGLGIATDEKDAIFEPFRRGTGITERAIAGIGIGLALVKGLVELLSGRIEVVSESIENSQDYFTSFTLILPQSSPTQNS